MPDPFDRFIILADMRTGSNFLEANLNALEGVTCHGESFNPYFIGKKDRTEYLGITLEMREADPLARMARIEAETPGLNGFRFFHDHDPRILAACLADRRCAKIVLTRNPVESYVSLKIARATGQWKLGDARRRREASAKFDEREFEDHLQAMQLFQVQILHALQTTGQTAFYLDYEDVGDIDVLNGLAQHLGLAARLEAPVDTLKKQNPEPVTELVVNAAQMETALSRLDRFNLSRSPSFEPRRGPPVPAALAAAGAGALYLPVRCGPEAEATGWLARLAAPGASAGLIDGFTQKTLRQWMHDTPGFRSFTVLRHPLARAHAAFCDRIVCGGAPEARMVLKRAYKLDLPPVDKPRRQDRDGHRAAFAGFLRFLRGNLAGQTSVRVDAAWASQAAILQGWAQFAQPDLILREDRLAEGLGFVAAQLGLASPAIPAAPKPDVPHSLADIWDAELEAAAREAYGRDYQTFGFSDWAPAGR